MLGSFCDSDCCFLDDTNSFIPKGRICICLEYRTQTLNATPLPTPSCLLPGVSRKLVSSSFSHPGFAIPAMVAVDVASKPTLATYNIRPDNFDPKRPGPPNKLQRAKDRDEAILGFGN